MKKIVIEKGGNLVKYQDGSADVLCSVCGEWEEVKAGSKQANLLQVVGKEKGWTCMKCWLAQKDAPSDEPKSWEIGQAINLSVQELTRNGVEITAEKIKAKVGFYLPIIKEIQESYRNND